jgi:hypothetical protein
MPILGLVDPKQFGGPLAPLGGVVSGTAKLAEDVDNFLTQDLLSGTWWNKVGVFTLGAALTIAGAILFMSTTKTGQEVQRSAGEAAVAAAMA